MGCDEASGLGRLAMKDTCLEARVQVLNPITTNLTCDWRLPFGCDGTTVLVLGLILRQPQRGMVLAAAPVDLAWQNEATKRVKR